MNGKQKTLVALGILFFACVVIWAVRTVPEAPKITIIDSANNHFCPVGDFRVIVGSVD